MWFLCYVGGMDAYVSGYEGGVGREVAWVEWVNMICKNQSGLLIFWLNSKIWRAPEISPGSRIWRGSKIWRRSQI